jgi:hypothetical protein
MLDRLTDWGPVTVLLVGITFLVVGGGVGYAIFNPDVYSFPQLLDDLKTFAIGLGILGLGRGVNAGLTNAGLAVNLPGVDPRYREDEPSGTPDDPDRLEP